MNDTSAFLPADGHAGTLIGRAWLPGAAPGPAVVALRAEGVCDLSAAAATVSTLLERGEPVYKSRDWHPAKTKHFAAYGGTWPVHCVQNTRGAEFHEDQLRVLAPSM